VLTGYFGSLTQASLAEYQAAVGIAPAADTLDLKTRAYLAVSDTRKRINVHKTVLHKGRFFVFSVILIS